MNQSIKDAFARFKQHIVSQFVTKDELLNIFDAENLVIKDKVTDESYLLCVENGELKIEKKEA